MKLKDMYKSTLLKAEDIKGHEVKLVIEDVTIEEVGDEKKPVIRFKGKEKRMQLNRTNAELLAGFYGDDTEAWKNQEVTLVTERVMYQGKMVDGLRFRIPNGAASGAVKTPQEAGDEIPF
jgi:hypothetical protein